MAITLYPASGMVGPGTPIALSTDAVIGAGGPYSCSLQVHKTSNTFIIGGHVGSWPGSGIAEAYIGVNWDFFSGFQNIPFMSTSQVVSRGDSVNLYLIVQDHAFVQHTFGPLGTWVWEPSVFQINIAKMLSDLHFTLVQPLNDILARVTVTAY